MAGGSALLGYERHHLCRVEQGCIGGGEVPRHEHEGHGCFGDGWHSPAEQPRDGPVADIIEICNPRGEVAPGAVQCLAKALEGVVDGIGSSELIPSSTRTYCAYKGQASYWSAAAGDRVVPDVAWAYQQPRHDAARVRGLIAFFNERLDVIVDGERLERPITPWSPGPGT